MGLEQIPSHFPILTLVTFLLSAEAGFITGQNFIVDGGMTRKMIYRD